MYRGDFMESASMLEEFKRENPTRKIIFLNATNEKYFDDYVRFNLDILSEGLRERDVDFCVCENGVIIYGNDIVRRLLFDCAVLGAWTEGGVLLKPYASACDIMSAVCRIGGKFGKFS